MANPNARKTKYNAKTYDTILTRIKLDGSNGLTVAELNTIAADMGYSQNAYVIRALLNQMSADRNTISITVDPEHPVTIDEDAFSDLFTD